MLILHEAPHLYFILFFQRSDDTARSAIQRPNTDSAGFLFFSAPRPRLGLVFYLLYIPTQTQASYLVGLPVRLLVCLFRSVCFFVFLQHRDGDSGSSFIYCCFSVDLSPWKARRQQYPGGHEELPRLCRQEQGVVSTIEEQAARLPVSLQIGRIRRVSR